MMKPRFITAILSRRMVAPKRRARSYSMTLRNLARSARPEDYSFRCVAKRPPARTRVEDINLLINYGIGTTPVWWDQLSEDCIVLNTPQAVALSSNKIATFRALDELEIPAVPWTREKAIAQSWLKAGRRVAVRGRVRAMGGKGMSIAHPGDELADARLYTRLVRGEFVREFRTVFFNGKPIATFQKRKRAGMEVDPYIRSFRRGWVFTVHHIELTEEAAANVASYGKLLHEQKGMGFMALDYVSNTRKAWVRVLETNTAPGIRAITLKQAIKQEVRNLG